MLYVVSLLCLLLPGIAFAQTAPPATDIKKPVVIFIPGVLGSKLIDNGTVIWGEDPVDAKNLIGNDGSKVKVEVLRHYDLAGFDSDVYGATYAALDNITRGGEDLLEFPYDWRQDIREVAELFDRRLKGEPYEQDAKHPKPWDLKGRDVYVVAHSMGGLVAWWWAMKHYSSATQAEDYKDKLGAVRRMVFLGTPLRGSCDIVRTFIDGYQDIPNNSESEASLKRTAYRTLYRKFFGGLKPAALVFPSIFQLLPLPPVRNEPESKLAACFLLDIPSVNYKPIQYFDAATWEKRCDAPNLGCDPLYNTILKEKDTPVWDAVGLDETSYLNRLKVAAQAGGEFRQELEESLNAAAKIPMYVPITLLGSSTHETVRQIWLLWKRGEYCILGACMSGNKYVIRTDSHAELLNGDGRVHEISAVPKLGPTARRPTDNEHGTLPLDKNFLRYISNELISE